MSGLKELIRYLEKVDEKYPKNSVNYVNIDLETLDNEEVSIDLEIRTNSMNLYSTRVTKKLGGL